MYFFLNSTMTSIFLFISIFFYRSFKFSFPSFLSSSLPLLFIIFTSPCFSSPLSSSHLTELGQESAPPSTHNATVVVSAAGVPYLQARPGGGEQSSALSISTNPAASSSSSSSSTSCERQPAPPGTPVMGSHPQGQSFSLGISNSGLGPPPPNTPGGVYTSSGQHGTSDSCPAPTVVSTTHTPPLKFLLIFIGLSAFLIFKIGSKMCLILKEVLCFPPLWSKK